MKIYSIIFLALACAHVNSTRQYGWVSGNESLFRIESQVLSGIPDINKPHHAGIKFMAQARVQYFSDHTLRVKLERSRFITLNGEIELTDAERIIGSGGPRSGSKENLPQLFKNFLEEPMLVRLKRGLVDSFFVSRNEPVSVTNIKRSFLAQLQLDLSGSQLSEIESNQIIIGVPVDIKIPSYSVFEESPRGNCRTMYNISPLTKARATELEQEWAKEERMAQLTPSAGGKAACNEKKYFEIIKVKDFDTCSSSPLFQKISGADGNVDAAKSHNGNLMSHVASATTIVCGDLSSFVIRKVSVQDFVVKTPVGYKTSARMMIELIKINPVISALPVPSQTKEEKSLVYNYPEQDSLKTQLSQEVVQRTQEILGFDPVLPQPGLIESPQSLIPLQLPVSKVTIKEKIAEQIRLIAQEISDGPESVTSSRDISGIVVTISKYLQMLSLNELEEVWSKCASGIPVAQQQVAKDLLLDAIAMTGTNPTTIFILKKFTLTGKISPVKSLISIQSALKSIKTPTNELLRKFITLLRQSKDGNQRMPSINVQATLTTILLPLSELFHRAYVNHYTMVSNYPVRIYGIFGTKDSDVLVNEYIPLLKEILMESKQSQNKHMEMVAITALGKLGHLDAAKILVEVAQGTKQEEPMVRSLAVYSMKHVSKTYPGAIKSVLLAIIKNPNEHADIRISALSVLPWTQPSYDQLQEIAVRSWFEPSNQVSSFSQSLFKSLQYTETHELKPIGLKVRGIMHLFKPAHYGLNYSKHFDSSKFVEYLQASLRSKVKFVNSKSELTPSKLAISAHLYLQELGSGLKLNINSFEVYSQGIDKVVDYALKNFADTQFMTPQVQEQLEKVADEINLETRISPEFMAFAQQRIMGYEFAALINADILSKIKEKSIEVIRSGRLTVQYVGVQNFVSWEESGMNEVGLPVLIELDHPSTLSISASLNVESRLNVHNITATLRPMWNAQIRSNVIVVSPFSEELINTGVTMSVHATLPVDAAITVLKGEIGVVFKTPEATLRKSTSLETAHISVLPYTARKNILSIETFSKSQDMKKILSGEPLRVTEKRFQGLISGEFRSESDNKFVDFDSYWEKIRQHSIPSLFYLGPLISSVRMSSVTLTINPRMSELKKVSMKLNLWSRKTPYDAIAKSFSGLQPLQNLECNGVSPRNVSVAESLNILLGASATVIKLEASLIGHSSVIKEVQAYVTFGSRTSSMPLVQSTAALSVKVSERPNCYGVIYKGTLRVPRINARWDKEAITQQPLEATYDAVVKYGPEEQNSRDIEKITLHSILSRTEAQTTYIKQSPEFKKCEEAIQQGRILSTHCIIVQEQAVALDKAEVTLKLPRTVYTSPVMKTIEDIFKANSFAYYKPIIPIPRVPLGTVKIVLSVARHGGVAQAKVEHKNDAYNLQNIRIPYVFHGVLPISARDTVYEWIQKKATMNVVPSTCRVGPEIVSTFDNNTYAYKINDCEHVLMMDGSKTYPVAVLSKTTSGEKKTTTVIAGQTITQFISRHASLYVLLSRETKKTQIHIRPGQIFREKDSNGFVLLEIRRYYDGVYHLYAPMQGLHVLTNGRSIEIVSPQILHHRSVGLCGDQNEEVVADVASPRMCIMTPKYAAMSYMINKLGTSSSAELRCTGIPSLDLPKYQKEELMCAKETIVPTQIAPIFEISQSLFGPSEGSSRGNHIYESGYSMEQAHQGPTSEQASRYSASQISWSESGLGCNRRCGTNYDASFPCQCNNKCEKFNDCCKDKHEICKGRIADDVLKAISEELLQVDDNNAGTMVQTNPQGKTRQGSFADHAPAPFFTSVDERAWNLTTINALLSLLDNYSSDVRTPEDYTPLEQAEEEYFLSKVLETRVMKKTYEFCSEKGLFSGSFGEFRTYLKTIWFGLYDRDGNSRITTLGSSGFEHVFAGEMKNGKVSGFHDWVYFYQQEKNNTINYLGYLDKADFKEFGSGISDVFTWNGDIKAYGSMFVGTSPELVMALDTICVLARPNRCCPMSLNNVPVKITTYTLQQDGHTYIGTAYPDWGHCS